MIRFIQLLLPLLMFSCLLLTTDAISQRVPVLNQIDLPHDYYFRELYLPQLTSGPSSVTWTPDGHTLIYSMAGSLWQQDLGSNTAVQLTDGDGYDYQPDCSPDGRSVVFVRYNGRSLELAVYDLVTKKTHLLTENGAVNLEPRWSPDGEKLVFVSTRGTGHFLLHTAVYQEDQLQEIIAITQDRESKSKRYYYSSYDHHINPVWSPDGTKIYFVSNEEVAHGSGNIVQMSVSASGNPTTIHKEETSWKTKPDISPDGTRMVYSSYLGRQWHQLWTLPVTGGYPVPLTYGDYDNTHPRWSPDGSKIAFISNRTGNTSLWILDSFTGKQRQVEISELTYIQNRKSLSIITRDNSGQQIPARLSITDSRGKFYSSREAWIKGDDSVYPNHLQFENHYIHSTGSSTLSVPKNEQLLITASHGPEYELIKYEVAPGDEDLAIELILEKLPLPNSFGEWWSGDLHVHMNYTGHYRATPEDLIQQGQSENLNFIYNLIVNKEQRIPDVSFFSTDEDPRSTPNLKLFHSQEYHTSFWGHLGLLNLENNFLIPGYTAYPYTAFESLFPHNVFIAKEAHQQNALVGYVHPFYGSQLFPTQSESLTNDLPVAAALGLVDYYELIGFAHHIPSAEVWYMLLNCGIEISVGAGTDAMTNYASLRGPVGQNRVYIRKTEHQLNKNEIKKQLKAGHSFVTNGPIIGLTSNGAQPGDHIKLEKEGNSISYKAFVRSSIPVDHLEIIWNGKVIDKVILTGDQKSADLKGSYKADGPGWLLARAWSEEAHPDLLDIYPYASTNPIYFEMEGEQAYSKSAAEFFLIWVNRLEKAALNHAGYRINEEKETILADIWQAKEYYKFCLQNATIE